MIVAFGAMDLQSDGTTRNGSEILYLNNKENYINQSLSYQGKHGFLPQALHDQVNAEKLAEHCDIVSRHAHKSDFSVIILIRYLYLERNPQIDLHRQQVETALHNFSFWTGDSTADARRAAMEHTIFWSENHIFMYLSTAYLYHQYLTSSPSCDLSSSCVSHHDRDQLIIYLEAHCHEKFHGVYEVLSCTYLPWTLCALLNLYDFALDPSIKAMSKFLLDEIVTLFCLVATKDGICNLTASARQYPDLRTRTWGHNINQLLSLITGKVHDSNPFKPSQLGDFFVTSSYLPPADILVNYFEYHGSIAKKRMNHLTKETREVYRNVPSSAGIEQLESVPFYWSEFLFLISDLLTHLTSLCLSVSVSLSVSLSLYSG
jgi:hypothetical protein